MGQGAAGARGQEETGPRFIRITIRGSPVDADSLKAL